MKTFYVLLGCLIPFGLWAAEAKPVVSKTAPLLGPAPLEGPEGKLNPEGTAPTALPVTEPVRVSSGGVNSISQDIQAVSHDEIPIVLEPPPTDLPFKDVVGFARPGQTERVLTGPVDHLPANGILSLAILDFRQAVSPLPIQIPSPPFIRMEVPHGAGVSNWSFQVEETEQVVYQAGGMQIPRDVVVWDGFKEGVMSIVAGKVYQPIFKLTDARGIPQQYFGDPIQLDVLQYDQDGVRHVEFGNDVLFQRDSSDIERNAIPFVRSLLNVLRENSGSPYRVVVHAKEGELPLAEKRKEILKRFLEDALVLDADQFVLSAEPVGSRGAVTEFSVALSTGTGL